MPNFLLKVGISVLVVDVIILLIDTFLFKEQSIYSGFIDDIFFAGLGLLAAGMTLKLLSGIARVVFVKKCPRCGKPVERNAIYCEKHLKETINEYEEQLHSAKS